MSYDMFHFLSMFPHSTADTPTKSVSQYLGQEKQKKKLHMKS